MTAKREDISAFVDNELDDIPADALHDPQAAEDWQRYHLIGDALRGELNEPLLLDLDAKIADAIANEPTILAPVTWQQRRQDLMKKVAPAVKHLGQYAIAASVAAMAIFGIQQYQLPEEQAVADTLPVLQTMPFSGGAAPVSLDANNRLRQQQAAQERQLAQQRLLQEHKRINAYFQDHQQQIRLQHSQEVAHAPVAEDNQKSQSE